MKLEKLIFSNLPFYVVARHLLFWLVYCFSFYIQSLSPNDVNGFFHRRTYYVALVSLLCFIPACAFSLYIGLYVVWPFFLRRKKYFSAFIFILFIFCIDICMNYFFSLLFHHYVESEPIKFGGILASFSGVLPGAYQNSVWAITALGIGCCIKLSKVSYLQQKENMKVLRRKLRNEIDLQKVRLQPLYLCRSLDDIHSHINANSENGYKMILKLSDVLNYSLYECEAALVPIEAEISAVNDFIELEKLKSIGSHKMSLLVYEDLNGLVIPPMIFLTFLQQVDACLKQMHQRTYETVIKIGSIPGIWNVEISIYNTDNNNEFPDLSTIAADTRKRIYSILEADECDIDVHSNLNEYTINFSFFQAVAGHNSNYFITGESILNK